MRADAQRSSAANRDGSASRGSVSGSRDDATRAPSRNSDGSGAPSRRSRRLALVLFAVLFAALAIAATAFASKEVINWFGTASNSGTLGGEFNNPRDIAVNRTGGGGIPQGTIYVADDTNNRIQRFDRDGRFVSTWGADVIQAGRPGDQVGTNPFEICTVAADCKAGVATGGNGAMTGNGALDNPQSVAVDSDTGYVYVSDRDNLRINAYDGSGNFLFSVGKDVADPDGGAAVEICVGGVDTCRRGDGGSGLGEIGSSSTNGIMGIAVSQPDSNPATGKVYFADSQNTRVNVYDLDGRNPARFGAAGATARSFGSGQPTRVAVDSAGIVYASNSNNSGEIERYDTVGAAFLDPITATVPPANETQRITFVGFSAGDTYTLTCPNGDTTGAATYNTGSTGRNNLLAALTSKCGGSANFSASGNPPSTTITYQGAFAGTNVPTMVCTKVTGPGTCSITQEVNGSPTIPGALLEGTPAGATSGLAVSSAGTLYVLRDPSSGNTVVQQFNSPGTSTPPATDNDKHGNGAGFSSVQGFGLDDSSGRLFVSATNSFGGLGSAHRVYVLADLASIPVPRLTIDPITVKGETTATFSGAVDPTGNPVSCRFQYSTDSAFSGATDVNVPNCASLDPNGGAQAVSVTVTGLDPNTTYFVRLAASRPLVPNSTTTTVGAKVFSTDSVPPVVSNVGAVDVQDTSARMVGTIDPRHSATGYVFEYGTTPALGSSTAPVDIGAGTAPLVLSQVVGGLSPDTTYYFKLVATNAFGSTSSVQHTFHTRATPLPLPDNRGYEQVSPVDKTIGDIDHPAALSAPRAAISPD